MTDKILDSSGIARDDAAKIISFNRQTLEYAILRQGTLILRRTYPALGADNLSENRQVDCRNTPQ